MEKQHNDDLSGLLHVKNAPSTSGLGKLKGSKKHWCVLNKRTNQLEFHKNEKEASTERPHECVPLFGAGISFGSSTEHEFIINIRGVEYCISADTHKTMMKWVNTLQKQVKLKPAVTGSPGTRDSILQAVPEDEPLEIKPTHEEKKTKKRSFFQRIFSRKRSRKDLTDHVANAAQETEEKRTVQAAPLRSVVGSMQDITDKKVSCNECNLMQGRNIYLNEQVQKLNEDCENIVEDLRAYRRKYESLETESTNIKRDFVCTILDSLVDEDDSHKVTTTVPFSKKILTLLERENNETLPKFNSDGKMDLHEDRFGFQHGKRDSPLQTMLYTCQILKHKYTTLLQESSEHYKKWQTFAGNVNHHPFKLEEENLLKLVQKGIPHEFRSTIWKLVINKRVEEVVSEKGKNYYNSLIKRLPDLMEEEEIDGSIEKQIKIDLLRTFPTHKDFQSMDSGKVPVLQRVLRAYILHNPEISYCQGMNFMVAFGLLYLDEETSFWLLVAVTELFFCKTHYNTYLSGTQANQRVFEAICHQEMPGLMKHLDDLTCELSPVTFNWFMTIFVDSLPIEVVLHVWDVFLVYGHSVLYKIAFSLIKIHQKNILKSKDSLMTMRRLKKMGKNYHDNEQLMNDVFNTADPLPAQQLLQLYNNYLEEIEEENYKRKQEDEEYEKKRQKLKFTPKQMMVSISDNLDALEDDMIIKCAECEANRNNVWLCCSSDLMAQIFVLNVASRNIVPIQWQVHCKCLDMVRFARLNMMLVSTIKSGLHAIDIDKKTEVWSLQLSGTALSISCDPSGNVILTLMDGTIAFLTIKTKEHPTQPTYVDISRSPVLCGSLIDDLFWCGAANTIFVLDVQTLETTRTMRVCPVERHSVSHLVDSKYGVWSSVEGSSVVHLWHKTKYTALLTVDILVEGGLASEKKTGTLLSTGITTIVELKGKLWVGFGNGRFIINDVIQKAEDTSDDLNDAITSYKTSLSLNDIVGAIKTGRSDSKKKGPQKLGVITCSHALVGERLDEKQLSPTHSHNGDDSTDFAMVEKRMSQALESGTDNLFLKMNQVQRICEHRVNCFVQCRNDEKLVLTCMGALNDDSSVVLWSSEKHDGREMWFAQTVSYSE
eukprot:TCONS_00017497-protein